MRVVVRLSRLLAVVVVAFLFCVLAWRLVAGHQGVAFAEAIRDGSSPRAPGFDLSVIYEDTSTWPVALRRRITDGRLSSSELVGVPYVLNFYASYCGPCRDEASILDTAAGTYAGRVAFVAVDTQDFSGDGRRFAERFSFPFAAIHDGSGAVGRRWGLTGIPETYAVDREGRAVGHVVGRIDDQELEALISRLGAG